MRLIYSLTRAITLALHCFAQLTARVVLILSFAATTVVAQPFTEAGFSPRFSPGSFDHFGKQILCTGTDTTYISSPDRNDSNTGFVTAGVVERFDLSDPNAPQVLVGTTTNNEEFGNALISTPDLTGNGLRDIIIGAPGENGDEGRVFLFSNSGSLITAFNPASLSGNPTLRFGTAIAYIGDIDQNTGEGPIAHFAITAPRYNGQGTSTPDGAVEIWSFSRDSNTFSYRDTIFGPADIQLGESITVLNDVDKDGFSELVIGALQDGRGAIHVYEWDPQTDRMAFVKRIECPTPGLNYSFTVQAIGDIDADMYEDLLVGAPSNTGTPSAGEFFVYSGRSFLSPTANTVQLCNVQGPGGGDQDFASSAVGMEDITGDGRDNFAVGFPGFNSDEGQIQIFSFSGAGGCTLFDTINNPGFGTTDFSHSMEYGLCDYTVTGNPDLIVGAKGTSTDQVHTFTDNTGRTNDPPRFPTASTLDFRISRTGRFRATLEFDENPLRRCTMSLYARATAGTTRFPVRLVDTTHTDQHVPMEKVVDSLPRVGRIEGERPVIHLMAYTQCGQEGGFRSNVMARYLSCGVCSENTVTPERWIRLLRQALQADNPALIRKLRKKRRRIIRKQRRCRAERRRKRRGF